MIRIYYSILGFFLWEVVTSLPAFGQVPDITYRISSAGRANLKDLHVEQAGGDMYLIGELDNTLSFSGWGSGKNKIGDNAATKDFFYAHYDASADGIATLLRFSIDGSEAYLSKLAVSGQYAYVLGSFSGKLSVYDHDGQLVASTGGTNVFKSNGNTDAFLIKLNKSTGQLENVFTIGGTERDFGDNLIIDRNNDVVVAGRFKGSVSFVISGFSFVLPTVSDDNDLFVARYNADDILQKLSILGGPGNQDKVLGLATDANNSLFVAGRFSKEVTIDGNKRTTGHENQVFVAKLANDFTLQWVNLLERKDDDPFPVANFLYHPETNQVAVIGRISDAPTYAGNQWGQGVMKDDLFLLEIDGSSGKLNSSLVLGGDNYTDGKQIAYDSRGSFLINGTFERSLSVSSGGLTKSTTTSGNQSTFLGVFNHHAEAAQDHGAIYLNHFSSPNDVFASPGLTLFEQGNQLEAYIPLVHDQDLSGLDGEVLSANSTDKLNILIARYRFPSIPLVYSWSRAANDALNPTYLYDVRGANIESGVAARLVDEGTGRSEVLGNPTPGGNENILVSLPKTMVAGKPYHLELDKGIYQNFYAFESFTVPPAVFALTDSQQGGYGDLIKIPGRYFGTQTAAVTVFLEQEGAERARVTPQGVAPEEIQMAVPALYPGEYQIRVEVNGNAGVGDTYDVLPRVTQVTASAPPGGRVTVRGGAFVDESHGTDRLTLSATPSEGAAVPLTSFTVSPEKPDEIQITLPESLEFGTYTLEVTVDGKAADGANTFVVVDPESTAPSVASILPEAAVSPGDTVRVQGENLAIGNEEVRVTIEGLEPIAALPNEQGTEATFVLPDDLPPGAYQVTLTVGEQLANGTLTLNVSAGESPPGSPTATVSEVTEAGFVLSWATVSGADRYLVTVTGSQEFEADSVVVDTTVTDSTLAVTGLSSEKTYYYRIASQDISGRTSGAVVQSVTTLPSGGVPTVIDLQPEADNPTTYLPDQESQALAVRVLGATDSDRIELRVEGLASREEQAYPATAGPNSLFSVPLASIDRLDDPIGIEYRFVAQHSTRSADSTEVFRLYRQYPLTDMTLYKPDQPEPTQQDYQLIALPFQEQPVASAWSGNALSNSDSLRLLRYDPSSNGDSGYQDFARGDFRAFEPGRGYWFLKRSGVPLQVQGTAAEVDQNRNFTIQLEEGWNLLGNPFPFGLNVSAFGEGAKRFYRNNGYEDAIGSLRPYEGMFVYRNEPSSLTISALSGEGSRTASDNGILRFQGNALSADNWYVGLTLSNGTITNRLAGVGMHEQARETIDRFDVPPMPRFHHFVEAQFESPTLGKVLERNIVAPTAHYTWTFTIEADPSSESITVSWNNQFWGENDRQLLLLDVEEQRLINMREATSYSFKPTQRRRTFNLFYGAEDVLAEQLMPHRVQVGQAYPNPATHEVNLSISVPPEQTSMSMELQISDATGRVVRRLSRAVEPGFHTIRWGRVDTQHQPLPDGLYFYRVSLNDKQFVGKLLYRPE